MIYKLTTKGIRLFGDYEIRLGKPALSLRLDEKEGNLYYWIASGPLEIESLINLGLIEEIL